MWFHSRFDQAAITHGLPSLCLFFFRTEKSLKGNWKTVRNSFRSLFLSLEWICFGMILVANMASWFPRSTWNATVHARWAKDSLNSSSRSSCGLGHCTYLHLRWHWHSIDRIKWILRIHMKLERTSIDRWREGVNGSAVVTRGHTGCLTLWSNVPLP